MKNCRRWDCDDTCDHYVYEGSGSTRSAQRYCELELAPCRQALAVERKRAAGLQRDLDTEKFWRDRYGMARDAAEALLNIEPGNIVARTLCACCSAEIDLYWGDDKHLACTASGGTIEGMETENAELRAEVERLREAIARGEK